MKRLLLIDDEEKLRNLLARVIGVQGEGFQVDQAGSLKAARQKLTRAQFDVVLCDVRLSDGSGVDFVHEVRQIQPLTEIILLTAYGNIPDGVQAIKNGAFDYIIKGNDNNRIIPLISRAYEKVLLAKRVQQLEQRIGQRYSFDNIIGSSKQILEAISLGKKLPKRTPLCCCLAKLARAKRFLHRRYTKPVRETSNRSWH